MQTYKVILTLRDDFALPGSTIVKLNVNNDTPDGVLQALAECRLTAADLRARTLFVPDATNPLRSCLMYAALVGFSARYLDYVQESSIVEASATHRLLKKAATSLVASDDQTPWLQVGSPYQGITSIPYGFDLTEKEISEIKSSKKVRIALAGLDSGESLNILITVCGIRSRDKTERMPFVVMDPSLPWERESADEAGKNISEGFDLEDLRKKAGELRRSKKIDKRDAIVEPYEVSDLMIYLQKASEVPVEEVLTKLKTRINTETQLWHCPRPDRHRNKDANASTKVTDGLVRCFRCDAEPIDSLRLVMDCLQLDPREAAIFIIEK